MGRLIHILKGILIIEKEEYSYENIDRIQTNILEMINRYVGKKYIYILPLVYHDHEDHRNVNDWENRVALSINVL